MSNQYSISEKKRILAEKKVKQEKIRTMKNIKEAYDKAKLNNTVKTTRIERD